MYSGLARHDPTDIEVGTPAANTPSDTPGLGTPGTPGTPGILGIPGIPGTPGTCLGTTTGCMPKEAASNSMEVVSTEEVST